MVEKRSKQYITGCAHVGVCAIYLRGACFLPCYTAVWCSSGNCMQPFLLISDLLASHSSGKELPVIFEQSYEYTEKKELSCRFPGCWLSHLLGQTLQVSAEDGWQARGVDLTEGARSTPTQRFADGQKLTTVSGAYKLFLPGSQGGS